ncbi:MAG: hypothetical protein ABSE92_06805 [Terriglobales bacterium]|jgi:hypothetical protein
MEHYFRYASALLLTFFWCPGVLVAQGAAPAKTLIVNGRSSPGAVVQMNGKSYVDVEAFAQAVDATVRFETNKVILTMGSAPATVQPAQKPVGLSREFSQAGIATLSDMREWRGGIASALRFGVAAGNWLGPWLQDYQVRAQKSLDQASLAAKTESDQKAAELLRNELTNVKQWDAQAQATIQSLNAEPSINPASTESDPLRLKIADCSTFLVTMLVSGEYADNANCH